MAESMLASGMTDGQIDDLADKLRHAARKHRDHVSKDVAQQALWSDNIGMAVFVAFRKLAEEIGRQVVHLVTVDRKRSPEAALKACGRKRYVTDAVVDAMPRGTGEKVKLVYFEPGPECYRDGGLSCDALNAEYQRLELVPDPQAQTDDNVANPEFADKTPNACQWVDADGNYCCTTFNRWDDERYVSVHRDDNDWGGGWVFAGVPQESSSSTV